MPQASLQGIRGKDAAAVIPGVANTEIVSTEARRPQTRTELRAPTKPAESMALAREIKK